MQNPNFNRNQFIDDVLLNTAAAQVSGNIAALGGAVLQPGLLHPEAVTWNLTSLVATVNAGPPFQVMFSNGVLASAHGTINGQDSQQAAVNFASVAPASGSVTAYLVCSLSSIQQNPVQVIGPPPGHPDFNPAFQPITVFNSNVDTLVFSAQTTKPDNVSSFEIFNATLAAGATTLTNVTPLGQKRASVSPGKWIVGVSGGSVLAAPQDGGKTYVFGASGSFTLPPAAQSNGLPFTIVSTTPGTVTLQAQGGDLIFGTAINPGIGQQSIPVAQGASVTVVSVSAVWQIISGTASALGSGPSFPLGGIIPFAGNATPAGWVMCNGQQISKTTFPALFAVIGYTFGGNGGDLFGTPDLRGRVIAGVDTMGGAGAAGILTKSTIQGCDGSTLGNIGGEQAHQIQVAELPTHTHNFSGQTGTENQQHNHSLPNAAAGTAGGGGGPLFGSSSQTTGFENQAHNHNFSGGTDGGSGGNQFHNIVQPTMVLNYLMRAL